MELVVPPSTTPRLVHPILIVIKNHRGVYTNVNETMGAVLGDVVGHHQSTVLSGTALTMVANGLDQVVQTKRPKLNLMNSYHSPYTGQKRYFRVDLYPLFDASGNVTAVAHYGNDVVDKMTIDSPSEMLRPHFAMASLIVDSLSSINYHDLKQNNVQTLQKAKKSANELLTGIADVCHKHAPQGFEERFFTRDCYLGSVIIHSIGLLSEKLEASLPVPAKGKSLSQAEKEKVESTAVISLQIDTRARMVCHCDPSLFDVALRHAVECALSTKTTKIDILISEPADTKHMLVEVVWPFQERLEKDAHNFLRAAQETAEKTHVQFSWSKTPRSKISFKVPLNKGPVRFFPIIYSKSSSPVSESPLSISSASSPAVTPNSSSTSSSSSSTTSHSRSYPTISSTTLSSRIPSTRDSNLGTPVNFQDLFAGDKSMNSTAKRGREAAQH